eukprot:4884616-Prorocentrum_lima.AAC.1
MLPGGRKDADAVQSPSFAFTQRRLSGRENWSRSIPGSTPSLSPRELQFDGSCMGMTTGHPTIGAGA